MFYTSIEIKNVLIFLIVCVLQTKLSHQYSGPWLVATDKFGFHYIVKNQQYLYEIARQNCLKLSEQTENVKQFHVMVLAYKNGEYNNPDYEVKEIKNVFDYGSAKTFVCSSRLDGAILWYQNGTTTHTYDIPKCCYPQEYKRAVNCVKTNMAGCILIFQHKYANDKMA